MKRRITRWVALCMLVGITLPAMGAMSISKMRQNTRFLTDRMAYELKLSPQQYDDVYEVNYDFINHVRHLMDDVVRGNEYALDRYYDFLDVRNDDLRWILSNSQYRLFMNADYFYRPIDMRNNQWKFRVYAVYYNADFFYFGKPRHYATYRGEHYRTHFGNVSYYKTHHRDRYHHDVYDGHFHVRPPKKEPHRPGTPLPPPHEQRPVRPHTPSRRPSAEQHRPSAPQQVRPAKRPSRREPEKNPPSRKESKREHSRREK